MLYWGFGFALLATATLLLGISGVPGLGPVVNVALVAAILLLAGGVVTLGDRRHHFGGRGRR